MHLSIRSLILLLVAVSAMAACKKENTITDFQVIDLGINAQVRSILVQNDSLIVSGGNTDEKGFVTIYDLQTQELESLVDSLRHPIYSTEKLGQQYFFGSTNNNLFVSGPLPRISQYYFAEPDWIVDLYYQPFRQMLRTEDALFMITGGNLSYGAIYQKYDDTESWSPRTYNNELRCIANSGTKLWAGGNGILLKTNLGDTAWSRLELDHKFIVGIHFFSETEGLAICFDGEQLKTDDGGNSWKKVGDRRGSFIQRLRYVNGQLLAVGNDGLIGFSADKGADFKWVKLEDVGDLHDVVWRNNHYFLAGGSGLLIQLDESALK